MEEDKQEYDRFTQYLSKKDGSIQTLSDNFAAMEGKNGKMRYYYYPHGLEYEHPDDLGSGAIPGTQKADRWEWMDKAGEAIGKTVMSSPTLRTVLPPALQALSYLELPGEEWFANKGGHTAEVLGVDKRIGQTAAYMIYPGLAELKPISKIFSSNLDRLITSPEYGKFNSFSDINRSNANLNDNIDFDLNKPLQIKNKGGGSGFKPEGNWQTKYTKNFSDTNLLKRYEEAAYNHRKLRSKDAKKNLMNKFLFDDGKPYIVDDNGQKYLLVRRSKRVDEKDFISKKNYQLLPESVILDRLLKNSGWTPGSRELREIKRLLNRKDFSLLSDRKFYEPLIEHGVGNVYLEHKIARGQSWFWKEVQTNPNFAPWLDPKVKQFGRNSEFNIRILFNQDYKNLKDSVERTLTALNSNKAIEDKFIISIEDPMNIGGNTNYARMSNPGNISVLKAGSGEKVGVVPDYLMNLYSKGFEKKWKDNYKYLIDRPNNKVPDFYKLERKTYRENGKTLTRWETFKEWRQRVIGNRLTLILDESGNTNPLRIGEHVITDRVEFFDLFNARSDWIPTPSHIEEFLDK
tara:strand:- start:39 stop:1757 length:1719 start_codon:yes stop_codon:yes gene_type:complete